MSLSDDDIKKLAGQLTEHIDISIHDKCKFTDISLEDLEEAIKFYKNFNRVMEEGKLTLWKTLVIGLTTGTTGLMLLGIYHKFKDGM